GPVCRFKTFDGMTVLVRTKDADGKTYARFEASFEAPPAAETTQSDAGKAADGTASAPDAEKAAEAKTADAKPDAKTAAAKHPPEEVKKEVDELTARLSPWAFVIPTYNRTTFAKQMSDMVKDKTPPKPPAGEGEGAADEDDGEGPMVIPGDLPPEIQEQIK